jgi:hypothetical protein
MEGYGVFLMVELGRLKGVLDSELEYDLLWETAAGLYEDFENSSFNKDTIGEYDAISNYLESLVDKREPVNFDKEKEQNLKTASFLKEAFCIDGECVHKESVFSSQKGTLTFILSDSDRGEFEVSISKKTK